MRWVTFRHPTSGEERVGVLVGEDIHALPKGSRLLDLLGDDGERLAEAGAQATTSPDEVLSEWEQDILLPPIPHPPSVRDFYAFEQHVRVARQRRGLEMDPDWYELPVFYFSNPNAVKAPYEDIAVPPGCTGMDFELGVAAVGGLGGANLNLEEAERHVAGLGGLNGWRCRDIQRREMKLSMGPVKGKDFATSLGPCLVTPDELEPYRRGRAYDLAMRASVNDEEYSRATLADIFWSFGEMLAYASRGTEVVPGDVIGSETCRTGCILEL